jgi:hypothetical protein
MNIFEKDIPIKQNKSVSNIISLNQGRQIGDKFINEYGEVSSNILIAYISESELTIVYRKGNKGKYFHKSGYEIEFPIVSNLFSKRKGLFENYNSILLNIIENLKKGKKD